MSLEERAREVALASVLSSYPDAEVEATIREIAPALRERAAARPFLAALDSEGGFDDLRHAYVDLFDRGEGKLPLYETEYGRMRALGKGRELADISGFYRAFGLRPSEDMHEMLDHVAVELEFYAMLLAKQAHLAGAADEEGVEVVEGARRAFLKAHLGPLAAGIARRLAGVPPLPSYGGVLAWCAALVDEERAALGVELTDLDVAEVEPEAEQVTCGNVRLPVVS